MFEAIVRRLRTSLSWLAVTLAVAIAVPVTLRSQAGQGQPAAPPGAGAPAAPAQGRGGPGPGGPGRGAAAAAKDSAPVDLTGYWVSIVTEDWIERMSPDSPRSGTDDGRGGGRGGGGGAGRGGGRGGAAPQAAAGSEPCRAYGAAGSLRVPGRLNITWADDNTLKIDMDAGTQTRLLKFNTAAPAGTPKTLQGFSVATWDTGARGGGGFGGGGGGGQRGGGARAGGAPAAAPRWGSLRVVTTNMTGGYLLSSRSSYSENATLTEHFTRHSDFGAEYFTVTAIVDDGGQSITSSTFKKEPDGSKFKPAGCEIVR